MRKAVSSLLLLLIVASSLYFYHSHFFALYLIGYSTQQNGHGDFRGLVREIRKMELKMME